MRRLPSAALACAAGLLLLMNTPAAVADGTVSITPFSEARGSKLPAPWRSVGLPGSSKPLTRFDLVPVEGATVLRVLADHSYANLVHDLPDVMVPRGTLLRWRWRLEQALPDADLRHRETDDTALKVCLLFNAPPNISVPWNRVCSVWPGPSVVRTCLPQRFATCGTTRCPWEPS